MATIKITTAGDNERFVHDGLTVTRNWTELDLDSLSPETGQALIDYVGRFVRVHDEDQDAFKTWLGSQGRELKYEDGKVTDPVKEQRAREEQEASQRPGRSASGTLPGQPPGPNAPPPPRDDVSPGSFQASPGSVTAQEGRDRSNSTTEPDRPSRKPIR